MPSSCSLATRSSVPDLSFISFRMYSSIVAFRATSSAGSLDLDSVWTSAGDRDSSRIITQSEVREGNRTDGFVVPKCTRRISMYMCRVDRSTTVSFAGSTTVEAHLDFKESRRNELLTFDAISSVIRTLPASPKSVRDSARMSRGGLLKKVAYSPSAFDAVPSTPPDSTSVGESLLCGSDGVLIRELWSRRSQTHTAMHRPDNVPFNHAENLLYASRPRSVLSSDTNEADSSDIMSNYKSYRRHRIHDSTECINPRTTTRPSHSRLRKISHIFDATIHGAGLRGSTHINHQRYDLGCNRHVNRQRCT